MNGRVTITRQDTAETLEIDNVTTAGLGFQWAVTAHPRESGLPVTDSTTPPSSSRSENERSRIDRYARDLWGIAATGDTLRRGG